MQTRHAIQGHLTGNQFQARMMNMSNSTGTPSETLTDIPLDDLAVEDVAPAKKEVPFLTKKGKMVLAVILVASTLYYIWQRKNNSETKIEGAEKPAESQPAPAIKPAETVQTVSNEQGTEGVDLV